MICTSGRKKIVSVAPCTANRRSRPGRPLTVAGNPPLRFATAGEPGEARRDPLPGFGLFFVRVLLNDVLRVSLLPIAEVLVYAVLVIGLVTIGSPPLAAAVLALLLTEALLVAMAVAAKAVLVGNSWGRDDATPFWSLRHFFYFFAQDCFFVWCRRPLRFAAGTLLANPLLRYLLRTPVKGYPWLEKQDVLACMTYAHRLVGHERIEPALQETGT